MKMHLTYFVIVCVAVSVAGCARTDVEMTVDYGGKQPVPRPARIIVYDFDASPSDVELDMNITKAIAQKKEGVQPAQMQQKISRDVSNATAIQLVKELQALGLPAQRAPKMVPTSGQGSLIAIEGEFLTMDEGSRLGRMVIGLGAGATEVTTQVRTYAWTGNQRQLLQEFRATAKSGRKPGAGPMGGAGAAAGRAKSSVAMSVGTGVIAEKQNTDVEAMGEAAAKEIVKNMRPFLVRQGWIK